nr:MAG TPA: hypothetical protein [Caudoviricetes sp.]
MANKLNAKEKAMLEHAEETIDNLKKDLVLINSGRTVPAEARVIYSKANKVLPYLGGLQYATASFTTPERFQFVYDEFQILIDKARDLMLKYHL